MKYFSAYWQQVLIFYRTLWVLVFKKERELDGPLAEYVMKPGFFWEVLEMHRWLLISVFKIPVQVLMLALSYVAFAFLLGLFAVAPVIVLAIFPVFMVKNYKEIKLKGEAL